MRRGGHSVAEAASHQGGYRVLILNSPDGYAEEFGPLPDEIEVAVTPDRAFDCVHVFVKEKAELDHVAVVALQAVRPDGLLWISWPKQRSKVKTDITRDIGWDAIQRGMRGYRHGIRR